MPHTTRKNYKTKLLERREVEDEIQAAAVNAVDEAYQLFRDDNNQKADLRVECNQLANAARACTIVMDESREVGNVKFAPSVNDIDQMLTRLDLHTIVRRCRDVLYDAEDRIGVLAEALTSSERARVTILKRVSALQTMAARNAHAQYEMHYIGPAPTDSEKQKYNKDLEEGSKFHRFDLSYDSESESDDELQANGQQQESGFKKPLSPARK